MTRALEAEARIMWLGADPAAGVEATIFEIGAGITAGPAAPCTAPLESLPPPPGSELEPPSVPQNLTAKVGNSNTVTLSWDASTDNIGVTAYGLYRNGLAIANVQNSGGTAAAPTEVGCGTGAILHELITPASLPGLDIDPTSLMECQVHAPGATLVQGNALSLPHASGSFDIVYCHFLLLWVHDPLQVLLEMKRVTKQGGNIIAFAEPDYSNRIDQPDELIPLGKWQTESLKRQGADPGFGARLAESFFEAGIKIKETGAIQGGEKEALPEEWEIEWEVIQSDLKSWVPGPDILRMKELDKQAREQGKRVLHVPTYFAWGRV